VHYHIPLVLQLDLDRVANRCRPEQLSHSDGAADAGQAGAPMRPQGAVPKHAGDVRKLLRAAVGAVAKAREKGVAEVAAVGRLHLHDGLVVLQEHTHRVVVRLVWLG
jgi:hypothetical protein